MSYFIHMDAEEQRRRKNAKVRRYMQRRRHLARLEAGESFELIPGWNNQARAIIDKLSTKYGKFVK